MSVLLQLAVFFYGGDVYLVGKHRDTRLIVVAQVALTIGRNQTDGLAHDGNRSPSGFLLKVVAFYDGLFLRLEGFYFSVRLSQLREHFCIVIDIGRNTLRERPNIPVELHNVGRIRTHSRVVFSQFLFLLDEFRNLLYSFLQAIILRITRLFKRLLLLFRELDDVVELFFSRISRHRSLYLYLLISMDTHASTTHRKRGRIEGISNVVALDNDTTGLTNHLRARTYHVLMAVYARILGNLSDTRSPHFQRSTLTGSLQTYIRTSHHDGRTARKEGAVAIYVAYHDFWRREYQPMVVAHVAALLHLGQHLKLHLLYLSLTLTDFCQVFLYTVCIGRQLIFPFFEYIVHNSLLFTLLNISEHPLQVPDVALVAVSFLMQSFALEAQGRVFAV